MEKLQTLKVAEEGSATYVVRYKRTRLKKGGYWEVLRITVSGSTTIFEIATADNNPSKDIDFALDNYQTLAYNYLKDI